MPFEARLNSAAMPPGRGDERLKTFVLLLISLKALLDDYYDEVACG